MGAMIGQEESGIWVVRIYGALSKEEMDAVQAAGVKGLGSDNARVLVVVEEDFLGWIGSEVWNDMSFFSRYGDRIARIAVVGDPKWESRMLMFAGAGFRRTEVRYFTTDRLSAAYAWLNAEGRTEGRNKGRKGLWKDDIDGVAGAAEWCKER